ncbi:MAG TPA: transcriptional regulator, partial [Burkholderiales bacterium]|nr:transcriptional regulator [Burkholderiales bacterium]
MAKKPAAKARDHEKAKRKAAAKSRPAARAKPAARPKAKAPVVRTKPFAKSKPKTVAKPKAAEKPKQLTKLKALAKARTEMPVKPAGKPIGKEKVAARPDALKEAVKAKLATPKKGEPIQRLKVNRAKAREAERALIAAAAARPE